MDFPQVSVIIVSARRRVELQQCLASVMRELASLRAEVIVVFNGDSSYHAQVAQEFPGLQCIVCAPVTPGEARNLAAARAAGEWIFFLDDDCELPPGYAQNIPLECSVDVLGGPDMLHPQASSFQTSVSHAMASFAAGGRTRERHRSLRGGGVTATCELGLSACNLWVKSYVMRDRGFTFDPLFLRNEESEWLRRIEVAGFRICKNHDLVVWHHRRKRAAEIARNYFVSGAYRYLCLRRIFFWRDAVFLLPSLMIVLALPLYYFIPQSLGVFLLVYVAAVSISVRFVAHRFDVLAIALHPLIHVSYGVGMLAGVFQTHDRSRLVRRAQS